MEINELNKPTLGGFGLVRTNGFMGKCIRLGTRSQINHAFVIVHYDEKNDDWDIVEAEADGAQYSKLSKYKDLEVVFSDFNYAPSQGLDIARAAENLVGMPYNFLDIFVLFLLSIGIKNTWIARRAQREDRLICSQLVDRAYHNAGFDLYDDGRNDGDVTPGDLLMYVAQGYMPMRDH